MDPEPEDSHERDRERSYRILQAARDKAARVRGYDSARARADFITSFRRANGFEASTWQVDTSEAMSLGLDTVVIAGTGSGKTMPFMMPLLVDSTKKSIVISPLKALQADQAERFKKAKVSAVAVNGDTWNDTLDQQLRAGMHQGLLAGPEMCIEHPGFRRFLTETNFENLTGVYIDEGHCIAQWGGEFRKTYADVYKLRAFFPPKLPVLVTSATFTKSTLREVRTSLGIDVNRSFFLNLGNDRPNISYHVHRMDSAQDYDALKPHLSHTSQPTTPDDFIKTIIFVNDVKSTQHVARHLEEWLPPHLHDCVDYISARRTPQARARVMENFREGRVKILIATEVAGMGMDIPDIEQVIQFGVPKSLTVWVQRAGRAGRLGSINARAILLVEKSMFERQRKKGMGKNDDLDAQEDEAEEEGVNKDDDEVYEWKKSVDEDLRRWIETEECRRIILDEFFNNPPNRKPPTGICCDNCQGVPMSTGASTPEPTPRPSTPILVEDEDPAPFHLTPSKSTNGNGKRKLVPSQPAARRGGDHLQEARDILYAWRSKTVLRQYTPSPFTDEGFMPDSVVKSLASAARIQSVADMHAAEIGWAFIDAHGQEVLDVLKRLDNHVFEERERAKQKRSDDRKAATRVRQEQKKQAQKEQRDALRRQNEQEREAKRIADENARLEAGSASTPQTLSKPRRILGPGMGMINFGQPTPTAPSSSSQAFSAPSLYISAHDTHTPTPFRFVFEDGQATRAIPPTPTPTIPRARTRAHPVPPSTPVAPEPAPLVPPRPLPRPRPIQRVNAPTASQPPDPTTSVLPRRPPPRPRPIVPTNPSAAPQVPDAPSSPS